MENKQIAKLILDAVGGRSNIKSMSHCVTRVRIACHDDKVVDVTELEKTAEVIATQFKGGQFQVIVGDRVSDVFKELQGLVGTIETPQIIEKKKVSVSSLMDLLAGCFIPLIPCFVGAGIIKGLPLLFATLGWLDRGSDIAQFLDVLGDATFYFLPFLLAYTSAKRFEADIPLAMVTAGILMHPSIMNNVGNVWNLGLPVALVKYSGTVVPILLSVWILKYVHSFIDRWVPRVLKVAVTPILTIIVMGFIALGITGPLGFYLSEYVARFFDMLFKLSPLLAGIIQGATRQFVILTGIGLGLSAVQLANIETLGYDMLGPVSAVATMAVAGVTFGVFLRAKRKETKTMAFSNFISAFIGVTEPSLYSILLPFKKPFIATIIAGAVSGGFVAVMDAKAIAFAMPSIISLPAYAGSIKIMLIGFAISFGVGAVVAYVLGIDEGLDEETLSAPVKGTIKSLSEVSDKTFSSGAVGQGLAVDPSDDTIYAPVSGEVMMVFQTLHAFGIRTPQGAEVLVHLGIDTARLDGHGFNIQIKEGDTVKQGQVIGSYDVQGIKSKGYDPIAIMVVTNGKDISMVQDKGTVDVQTELIKVAS